MSDSTVVENFFARATKCFVDRTELLRNGHVVTPSVVKSFAVFYSGVRKLGFILNIVFSPILVYLAIFY